MAIKGCEVNTTLDEKASELIRIAGEDVCPTSSVFRTQRRFLGGAGSAQNQSAGENVQDQGQAHTSISRLRLSFLIRR